MPLMPTQTIRVPYKFAPDEYMTITFPPRYRFEDQVYTYTAAGKRSLHIHIGKVWRIVTARPNMFEIKTCAISLSHVQHVRDNNGIEMDHLQRVDPTTLNKPGLMLDFGRSQAIIDGNHRFVIRALMGKPTMDFVFVRETQIRLCLLDLPQDFGLDEDKKGWGDRKELEGSYIDQHGNLRK